LDNADELADQREFDAAQAIDQSERNIKAVSTALASIPTGLAIGRIVQATRGYPHKVTVTQQPAPAPAPNPFDPNQIITIVDREIRLLTQGFVTAEQVASQIAQGIQNSIGSDIAAIKGSLNSILSQLHLPVLGGATVTSGTGTVAGPVNPGSYTYGYRDNNGAEQSIILPGQITSKDQFDALLNRVTNSPITVLSAIAFLYSGPDANGVWTLVPSRFGQ